jgi:peptide/nickel transport system substrate-binding protein
MRSKLLALALTLTLAGLAACRPQPEGALKVQVIDGDPQLRDPTAGPLSPSDAVMVANVALGVVRFDAG